MNVTWPEIFVTGKEPEEIKNHPKRLQLLCGFGLEGWGLACIDLRPEKFGEGMQHIGTVLGIVPLGDNFIKWSNENV